MNIIDRLFMPVDEYRKQQLEEEAQGKMILPSASALQRFGNVAPVPGTDVNPRTNPTMQQPAPDMSEFAPGTRLGMTESGAAAYADYEKKQAAEAAAQEQQLQRQGVSQYADLYEESDPEFANFLRMGVNTGILKDKKDVIDAIGKYVESQRGIRATQGKQEFESGENALDREASQKRAETMAAAGITRTGMGLKAKQELAGKPDEKKQQIAETAISLIDSLKSHPGRKGAVGFKGLSPAYGLGLKKEAISGSDEAGFEQLFNSLKGVMTLENMGVMKGVLSDADIKIIQDASLALTTKMNEKEFDAQLDLIRAKLERAQAAMQGGGVTVEDTDSLIDELLGQ